MDLSIFLNVPIAREVLGIIFLAFIPGLIIIQILKIHKIGIIEKILLSIGISAAFVMFSGILISFLPTIFGLKPFSLHNLLFWLNIFIILLLIVNSYLNKNQTFDINLKNIANNLKFNKYEKVLLSILIFLPVLTILGTYVINYYYNNIILMLLLFLIPIYIILLMTLNNKISGKIYPISIYIIGVSLLLIFMLRYPHITGRDVNIEYFIFQTTLSNLKWTILLSKPSDSCLSISVLPAVYQIITNFKYMEFLFKGIYVFLYSFSPLAIFIISKKYVNTKYAFLAAFFFMSQLIFLKTAASARTNIAILFLTLFVMVSFHEKINIFNKKILIILFLCSVIVSHYASAYILIIIIFSAVMIQWLFSQKIKLNTNITFTMALLFFIIGFLWYGLITAGALEGGVMFIKNVFLSLNHYFADEMRDTSINQLVGQNLRSPVLSGLNLITTWATFALIGIGVLASILKYKNMLKMPNIDFKKPSFLKTKIDSEFLVMSIVCVGLLMASIIMPMVSHSYDMYRLYALVLVFLSTFLVIGGIVFSRNILSKIVTIKPKFVISAVLILYFLFTTGAAYQLFGITYDPTLTANGTLFENSNVYDSEVYCAKFISNYDLGSFNILYTLDTRSRNIIISQGIKSPYDIGTIYYLKTNRILKLKSPIIMLKTDLQNATLNNSEVVIGDFLDQNKNLVYDSGTSKIFGGA